MGSINTNLLNFEKDGTPCANGHNKQMALSTLGVTVVLMLTIVFVSSKAIRDYYYDTAVTISGQEWY